MDHKLLSALTPSPCDLESLDSIASTLAHFPLYVLQFIAKSGVTIHPLPQGALYRERSPALARLGIDVDVWPAPPAGLFVVEERAVYLRSLSPMTVSHELGHAIDCALGEGVYLSSIDPQIRDCFVAARSFITPYAATGLDEYMAEAIRAYVDCNDPASAWPPATRDRLRSIDPGMHSILQQLFARCVRHAA